MFDNQIPPDPNYPGHALLWNSEPDAYVDLHPADINYGSSAAYGLGGGAQVGAGGVLVADNVYAQHALLWRGTPESVVDLHPTNLSYIRNSLASATDGISQVGWGDAGLNTSRRPLLWHGTADSAIDLYPENLQGFGSFTLTSVAATQQVGFGYLNLSSNTHAFLWTGTSDSVVDLHPTNITGVTASRAYATNGANQVGYAYSSGGVLALRWSGTAESAINLNDFLPPHLGGSWAYSIDESGVIFGVSADDQNRLHAVKWIPIPEPTAYVLAAIALPSAPYLTHVSLRIRLSARCVPTGDHLLTAMAHFCYNRTRCDEYTYRVPFNRL